MKSLRMVDEDLDELILELVQRPNAGIPLGGGLHKIRLARKGGGKSGGYRVLYFYKTSDVPLLFLNIFAESKQGNISQDKKKILIALCHEFEKSWR